MIRTVILIIGAIIGILAVLSGALGNSDSVLQGGLF